VGTAHEVPLNQRRSEAVFPGTSSRLVDDRAAKGRSGERTVTGPDGQTATPGGERLVAAFDFDGTITREDTFRLFLNRIGTRRALAGSFLRRSPQMVSAVRGGERRDHAKKLLCHDMLEGLTSEFADSVASDTAREVSGSLIRTDTAARIRWHQAQGHRIVVVSASFDAYVRPVVAELGIDEVIATRWEVDPATALLTGRLDGRNVRGDAKVDLLDAHLGEASTLEYAYGNSGGDKAMLARSRYPVWVGRRPMPELEADPPVGGFLR
jgi:phosphatidylglycerophosphatase C